MPVMVAIGAHHDDVELRSGGTLAKYVRKGWHVVYVVATTTPHYNPWPEEKAAGNYRSTAEVTELRKAEARKGAEILGIADVHFLDFKSIYWYKDGTVKRRYFDGCNLTVDEFRHLNDDLPGREFIVTASRCPSALDFLCGFLREKRADIVLTHFPDDGHWEHYAVAVFVCTAARKLAASGSKMDVYAWAPGGVGTLTSSFAPTHYVDISATIDLKCKATMSFASQLADHNPEFFAKHARERAREYGEIAGLEYAEPFMKFEVPSASNLNMAVQMPATYDVSKAVRELGAEAEES